MSAIVERKHHSRNKLHYHTEHKSYCHRQEYTHYNGKCLLGVEQFAEPLFNTTGHLDQSHHKGCSEQFEHHRHSGGGGHAKCVEHVEQYDVGHHYSHEDTHQFVERKVFRSENAMTGYLHHAVAHGRSKKHAYRRHYDYTLERSGLGPDGRIEKVYSIIAYTH